MTYDEHALTCHQCTDVARCEVGVKLAHDELTRSTDPLRERVAPGRDTPPLSRQQRASMTVESHHQVERIDAGVYEMRRGGELVAWLVVYPDGSATTRWLTGKDSTVSWAKASDAVEVHGGGGHGQRTELAPLWATLTTAQRPHKLEWSGREWKAPCGCAYHPDDDKGTHGGAPHVHRCATHGGDR